MRLMKYHTHCFAQHAWQAVHFSHTVLRGPIAKQVIFWKVKGTYMMRQRWCWVEDHAEALELVYLAAVAHTTHEYIA